MQFVLISGLSGSGKSVALNVLEDSGYYCVDNLPGQLLEQSVELLRRAGHDRVAMSIDARTGESLELVPEYVAALKRHADQALLRDAQAPSSRHRQTHARGMPRTRARAGSPRGRNRPSHRHDRSSAERAAKLDQGAARNPRRIDDAPVRVLQLRAGQPQLAHGRRRLHRRPAPLGVLRRAPRRSFSRPHSGAGAPPASCPRMKPTVAVALTGASGMPYGLRLIECLVRADAQIYLLYSQAAHVVAKQELDLALPPRAPDAERMFSERYSAKQGQLRVFGREDWFAPVASGSNPPDAMVICPCTVGTLAAVAAGLSDTLIERAADVMLKEGRKLILVPRETPFSALHLENMLKLARAGAVILPANPGFYNRPKSVEDLVDFIVARILDHLGVQHELMRRWGEER